MINPRAALYQTGRVECVRRSEEAHVAAVEKKTPSKINLLKQKTTKKKARCFRDT